MIKLRLLTILTAFLFIPAFALGVASLWTVVFAIVMAIFFHKKVCALDICLDGNEKKDVGQNLRLRFIGLILQCTLIACIPFVFVGLFEDQIPSSFSNYNEAQIGKKIDFHDWTLNLLFGKSGFSGIESLTSAATLVFYSWFFAVCTSAVLLFSIFRKTRNIVVRLYFRRMSFVTRDHSTLAGVFFPMYPLFIFANTLSIVGDQSYSFSWATVFLVILIHLIPYSTLVGLAIFCLPNPSPSSKVNTK